MYACRTRTLRLDFTLLEEREFDRHVYLSGCSYFRCMLKQCIDQQQETSRLFKFYIQGFIRNEECRQIVLLLASHAMFAKRLSGSYIFS